MGLLSLVFFARHSSLFVIPAKAGIQFFPSPTGRGWRVAPGEGRDRAAAAMWRVLFFVIPAKAGIHLDLASCLWSLRSKASAPLRGAGYFLALPQKVTKKV
jgi:hypothetical protein